MTMLVLIWTDLSTSRIGILMTMLCADLDGSVDEQEPYSDGWYEWYETEYRPSFPVAGKLYRKILEKRCKQADSLDVLD